MELVHRHAKWAFLLAACIGLAATTASMANAAEDTSSFTAPSDLASTTEPLTATENVVQATTTPVLASSPAATSTGTVLNCTYAYTADLYNTPSGHKAPGATIVGTQSWTHCIDPEGNEYEFKTTPARYRALGDRDAEMPREYATPSARVNEKTSHSTHEVPSERVSILAASSTEQLPENTSSTTATAVPAISSAD